MEKFVLYYKINLKKKVLKTPIFSEFQQKKTPQPPTSRRELFFDVPVIYAIKLKGFDFFFLGF